jgi:hypothetical protein
MGWNYDKAARFSIILVVIVIFQYHCISQSADTFKMRYHLSVTPSAIVNITPALQLGHDLRINDRFSFGLETGYIFANSNNNDLNVKGIRLRPAFKFHIYKDGNDRTILYLFYNYKHYKADRFNEFRRANGAYTEKVKGIRETTFQGFGVGMDYKFNIEGQKYFKTNSFGVGVGMGRLTNEYSDNVRPSFFDFFIFGPYSTNGSFLMPILFTHFSMLIF